MIETPVNTRWAVDLYNERVFVYNNMVLSPGNRMTGARIYHVKAQVAESRRQAWGLEPEPAWPSDQIGSVYEYYHSLFQIPRVTSVRVPWPLLA